MQNYNDLVAKSKVLVKAIYVAVRSDDIKYDHAMQTAITKPAISLVGCLSNASASRQKSYLQRGLGFGRSYVSEIRGVLEAAWEVGYLTHFYENLDAQAREMDNALAGLEGMLSAQFDR